MLNNVSMSHDLFKYHIKYHILHCLIFVYICIFFEDPPKTTPLRDWRLPLKNLNLFKFITGISEDHILFLNDCHSSFHSKGKFRLATVIGQKKKLIYK